MNKCYFKHNICHNEDSFKRECYSDREHCRVYIRICSDLKKFAQETNNSDLEEFVDNLNGELNIF